MARAGIITGIVMQRGAQHAAIVTAVGRAPTAARAEMAILRADIQNGWLAAIETVLDCARSACQAETETAGVCTQNATSDSCAVKRTGQANLQKLLCWLFGPALHQRPFWQRSSVLAKV